MGGAEIEVALSEQQIKAVDISYYFWNNNKASRHKKKGQCAETGDTLRSASLSGNI